MHPDDPGIMGLTLQVGRTAVAGGDPGPMLASVCAALPGTLGVSGAAIVLAERADGRLAGVWASDASSARLGETGLRARTGPVHGAVRSGRATVTPDLTRIGSPDLAAASADTGLSCSVVVPLRIDGEPAGALALFGRPGRPVGDGHVDAVAGLADVLSARLADVAALRRLTGTVARLTAEHEAALPVAHATGMLAERYRTDVEEAGRYLGSRARNAGTDLAEAARAVLDRTDQAPRLDDAPTTALGPVIRPAVPAPRRPERAGEAGAGREPGSHRPDDVRREAAARPPEAHRHELLRSEGQRSEGQRPGGRRRLEDRRPEPRDAQGTDPRRSGPGHPQPAEEGPSRARHRRTDTP